MEIGVIGVSYKTAELQVREDFARAAEKIFQDPYFLAHPIIYLFTCGRVEIYFSSEDLYLTKNEILQRLQRFMGPLSQESYYCYLERECFFHLSRVTSGLDSAILAESEIQRQVKIAYKVARERYQLSSSIHYIVQKALKIGKLLRSHYQLFNQMPGIHHIIWELIEKNFSDIQTKSLAFIGNSEINRRLFKYLQYRGMSRFSLCTSYPREKTLLKLKNHCHILESHQVSECLQADIIITASKQKQTLIPSDLYPTSLKKKQLIFDLSVPRNVDTEIGKFPLVSLYNIDQLDQREQSWEMAYEIQELEKVLSENVTRLSEIYFCKKRKSLLLRRGELSALHLPIYVSGF